MASWLVWSSWRECSGFKPWQWTLCCVLGKTLYSHSVSLHPGVSMGIGKLLGKPNKLRGVTCNRLASCPGEVEILLAASCSSSYEPVMAPRLYYANWLAVWMIVTVQFDQLPGHSLRLLEKRYLLADTVILNFFSFISKI